MRASDVPGDGHLTDAHREIMCLLLTTACRYSIHRHGPIVTVADAVALVPELTENLFKTVVFRKKGGAMDKHTARTTRRIVDLPVIGLDDLDD